MSGEGSERITRRLSRHASLDAPHDQHHAVAAPVKQQQKKGGRAGGGKGRSRGGRAAHPEPEEEEQEEEQERVDIRLEEPPKATTDRIPCSPEAAVGRKLLVWWKDDEKKLSGAFYQGKVERYDATTHTHYLSYPDEDDEQPTDLTEEIVVWNGKDLSAPDIIITSNPSHWPAPAAPVPAAAEPAAAPAAQAPAATATAAAAPSAEAPGVAGGGLPPIRTAPAQLAEQSAATPTIATAAAAAAGGGPADTELQRVDSGEAAGGLLTRRSSRSRRANSLGVQLPAEEAYTPRGGRAQKRQKKDGQGEQAGAAVPGGPPPQPDSAAPLAPGAPAAAPAAPVPTVSEGLAVKVQPASGAAREHAEEVAPVAQPSHALPAQPSSTPAAAAAAVEPAIEAMQVDAPEGAATLQAAELAMLEADQQLPPPPQQPQHQQAQQQQPQQHGAVGSAKRAKRRRSEGGVEGGEEPAQVAAVQPQAGSARGKDAKGKRGAGQQAAAPAKGPAGDTPQAKAQGAAAGAKAGPAAKGPVPAAARAAQQQQQQQGGAGDELAELQRREGVLASLTQKLTSALGQAASFARSIREELDALRDMGVTLQQLQATQEAARKAGERGGLGRAVAQVHKDFGKRVQPVAEVLADDRLAAYSLDAAQQALRDVEGATESSKALVDDWKALASKPGPAGPGQQQQQQLGEQPQAGQPPGQQQPGSVPRQKKKPRPSEGGMPRPAAAAAAAAAAGKGPLGAAAAAPGAVPGRGAAAAAQVKQEGAGGVEAAGEAEEKEDDGLFESTGNKDRDKAILILAGALAVQRPAFIAAFELEEALFIKHPPPAPGQQAAQQAQQGAPRGISIQYLRELRELWECLSPKAPGYRPLLRYMLLNGHLPPAELVIAPAEALQLAEAQTLAELQRRPAVGGINAVLARLPPVQLPEEAQPAAAQQAQQPAAQQPAGLQQAAVQQGQQAQQVPVMNEQEQASRRAHAEEMARRFAAGAAGPGWEQQPGQLYPETHIAPMAGGHPPWGMGGPPPPFHPGGGGPWAPGPMPFQPPQQPQYQQQYQPAPAQQGGGEVPPPPPPSEAPPPPPPPAEPASAPDDGQSAMDTS